MKRKLAPFVLILFSLAAVAQAGSNPPASTAAVPTKVGIINIQRAIVMTNEGQKEFETLQKKFEPKQNELRNLNKEIEDLKKQLQTQGDKLNDQARADLVRSIETKQKNLQRNYEDAQGELQNEQNEVANRIGGKLLQILDGYAKQNGYAVILDVSSQQSPVLWAGQSIDVTDEIVNAYNAQSNVPPPSKPAAESTPSAPSASKPQNPGN